MGSDYLFSSKNLRKRTFGTGSENGQAQNPEARENQKPNEFRGICSMKELLSCEFNIDTACVELRFADGRMVRIDCTAVENEVAGNRFERSELDYLIYNAPLEYAELVLNGDPEKYLKAVTEYKPFED
jgi:hypothetical protein